MKLVIALFTILLVLSSNSYGADPQYGGHCAMGMAERQAIATNCSVFWLAPDNKVYCFINEEAEQKFMNAPKENMQRAQAFWEDPENLKRLIRRE